MLDTLGRFYGGNTVQAYLMAAATFVAVTAAFMVVRRLLVSRLNWLAGKTDTKIDDMLVEALGTIRAPECYLVAFWFATRPLVLPLWAERGFRAAVILAVTYRVARILQRVGRFVIEEGLLKGQAQDATFAHSSMALSYLFNALIWSLAAVFALDNLGFSVSSMLAGLGIGGIAVALAAQAVLGDLFAAVAIYMDRPFVSGDAIRFGDYEGTVERIGFKTTRLRALSGEQLVVPNSALASAKIQNFRDLRKRNVEWRVTVAYGTPAEKLETLPTQIREILNQAGKEKVAVGRVHLKGLEPAGIQFEAVYQVLSPDFLLHCDIRQKANLALLAHLSREGIRLPIARRAQ